MKNDIDCDFTFEMAIHAMEQLAAIGEKGSVVVASENCIVDAVDTLCRLRKIGITLGVILLPPEMLKDGDYWALLGGNQSIWSPGA